MILENSSLSNFQLTIMLIEVIIWPFTFFLILFLFRKNLIGVFNRLGTIKVDSSGIAMSFEKELEIAKSNFSINEPEKMGKSKSSFKIEKPLDDPPYKQLLIIKESLDKALHDLAKDEGINIADKSSIVLCRELENKGLITKQKSELTQSLLKVVNLARMDITSLQINEIIKMYNAL